MLCTILLLVLTGQILVQSSEKRGVAHWPNDFICGDFQALRSINWWYDWSCTMENFLQKAQELQCGLSRKDIKKHVPMVWGFYPKTNYSCHMWSDSDVVLALNEPNHLTQANRLAVEAATAWPLLDGNATGKILVGPAAAHCGPNHCNIDGNTTEWFTKFFAACNNTCRVDAIATHTYWCEINKTMDFLEDLYNRYGKPIWLTEFACRDPNNNPDKVLTFLKGILPRLEGAPYIHKYAWYKTRITNNDSWIQASASLFEPDSTTPTPLGVEYLSFKAKRK